MTTNSDNDEIDNEIVQKIKIALKEARFDALQKEGSIVECHNGKLCRTYLDGTREFLGIDNLDIKVDQRFFTRRQMN